MGTLLVVPLIAHIACDPTVCVRMQGSGNVTYFAHIRVDLPTESWPTIGNDGKPTHRHEVAATLNEVEYPHLESRLDVVLHWGSDHNVVHCMGKYWCTRRELWRLKDVPTPLAMARPVLLRSNNGEGVKCCGKGLPRSADLPPTAEAEISPVSNCALDTALARASRRLPQQP